MLPGRIHKAESYLWKNLGEEKKTGYIKKDNWYFSFDEGGPSRHPSQIEMFNKQVRHSGAFDPLTGDLIHGPDPRRNVRPGKLGFLDIDELR